MLLFLNIVLVIAGTVFALTTFFGETWVKRDKTVKKRITLIGWISLICLLITFAAGLAKEFQHNKETAKSEQTQESIKQKLEKANKELEQTKNQIASLLSLNQDNTNILLNEVQHLSQTVLSKIERLNVSGVSYSDDLSKFKNEILRVNDTLNKMFNHINRLAKTNEQNSAVEIEVIIRESQKIQKMAESFNHKLRDIEKRLKSDNTRMDLEIITDKKKEIESESRQTKKQGSNIEKRQRSTVNIEGKSQNSEGPPPPIDIKLIQ